MRNFARRPPTPPDMRFRKRQFITSTAAVERLRFRLRHHRFHRVSLSASYGLSCSTLQLPVSNLMALTDFCRPIPSPFGFGSQWQDHRPPRVMCMTFPLIPAAYTSTVSVQISGFESIGPLTHRDRLLCDSCSSGQRFAFGFLQIPPRSGHPCRSANCSPCWANSGLAPPNHPATTT